MADSQDLSIEWLRQKVLELLQDASAADERDHPACAKYAELLFKMLPSREGRTVSTETTKAAMEAIANEKSTRARREVEERGA